MDVRDKLLFEPEYAGNIKENVPPRSSLCIPWTWLPGALCILQEVTFHRKLYHPKIKGKEEKNESPLRFCFSVRYICAYLKGETILNDNLCQIS